MNWLNFFAVVAVFITLGLAIVIIVLVNREKDVKDNKPFFINYATQGRAYGEVEELTYSPKFKRWRFVGKPQDLGPKSLNKVMNIFQKNPIKKVRFIIGRDNLISSPKTEWSNEKDIITIYPNSIDDSHQLKSTPLGNMLSIYERKVKAQNIIIDSMSKGFERTGSYLREMGHGEVSRENMSKIKAVLKDYDDMVKEMKKDKNTPSIVPPFSHDRST